MCGLHFEAKKKKNKKKGHNGGLDQPSGGDLVRKKLLAPLDPSEPHIWEKMLKLF